MEGARKTRSAAAGVQAVCRQVVQESDYPALDKSQRFVAEAQPHLQFEAADDINSNSCSECQVITVKISGEDPSWPLLRQTPNSQGTWGGCQFFVNDDSSQCDYWIVYDGLQKPETARCPPQNVFLFTAEPPSVRTYHPRFAAQFAGVITCHEEIRHRQVIHTQQALPWHLLNKTYDDLAQEDAPKKTKSLSVISSNKAFTAGHRQRVEFVERLTQRLDGDIDHVGKGTRVPNKWDGLGDYKYTVVIENSSFRDYWTEKIADAFLAGCHPFYFGCPNIGDYFPAGSYTEIDIHDFDSALAVIQEAIAQGRFEATAEARLQAKNLVLDKYNLFPVIAGMTSAAGASSPKERVRLRPDSAFSGTPLQRTKRWVRRILR